MYAIIEDSGTQMRVAAGDVLNVDLRDLGRRTKTVRFDRVLLLGNPESDDETTIGTPYVAGAAVTADILGEVKGEKIDVIKYKRRKGYRHKLGHRQRYLRVKIAQIKGPSAAKPKPRTAPPKTPK